MATDEDDSEITYALRFTASCRSGIAEAKLYLQTMTGLQIADDWQDGLFEVIRSLTRSPKSHPISPTARFFKRQVRQFRYQRRAGSVAYYVIYAVTDAGEDGPVVTVIHVRHSSRKPLTRSESQEIEKEI